MSRILVILFVLASCAVAPAESADGKPVPKFATLQNGDGTLSGKWKSPLLQGPVRCLIRLPGAAKGRYPVVVYLKNLPTPRLGKLDDATLIKGF